MMYILVQLTLSAMYILVQLALSATIATFLIA
jgi:hypothetical protein